jgi:hypothetical protein
MADVPEEITMKMKGSIGRVSTLTTGTGEIIVDSGQMEIAWNDPPVFCKHLGSCRKLIRNGTVHLSPSSNFTFDGFDCMSSSGNVVYCIVQ